jgi:PPK2 family polyphosphate:nucleotide phosphotransferase
MRIKPQKYRVPAGATIDLGQWPTRVPDLYRTRKDYRRILAAQVESLSDLQRIHYASNQCALLLIFQSMDTAGKDGVIRTVMSGVNPQGCAVHSFGPPSAEELEHDFLWRTHRLLPERGQIGIFNRSYYEEVLIVRVHPELLRAQGLSEDAIAGKALWEERYTSIRDTEAHLHRSGTLILKFFLHLSKEEQRARLLARIDEPEKNWKFSQADVKERRRWDDYQRAYASALAATSTDQAPWYIVPADDKKNARLIVSEVILAALRGLKLAYPRTTARRHRELQQIRKQLGV